LDFDFDPGAGWTSERDGQAYIFNDIQSMRQITIAVLNARSVLSDDELVQASRETLDIRKKIIRQLSSDRATFTDMGVTESEGGIDTSFSAVDPLNQVQIYCTVKARPLRVVTVSFNKYSPYLSDEDFRRQAESLIGSVKVN